MRTFKIPSMTDPEVAAKVARFRQLWVDNQVNAAHTMGEAVHYGMSPQDLSVAQYQYQKAIDQADEDYQKALHAVGVPA